MKALISQKEFKKRQLNEFQFQAVLDYHNIGILDKHDVETIFLNFLSDCISKNFYKVIIVCGTGKLVKKEIQKLLKKNNHVVSFNEGGYYTGGKGAYLVELR